MKKIVITVARVLLNVLFGIFKLLPVKKKIVYISRESDTPPVDFVLIKEAMEKLHPEYRNVVLAKMIHPGLANAVSYGFEFLKQMYHLATSEMAVLDTYCIAVSFLNQRKSLKVVQLWHAMGAMKKFGHSIVGKEEGSSKETAELMRMHKNYTDVCCSSDFCAPHFAEAFDVPLSVMRVMPLPRLDLLTDENRVNGVKSRIYEKYPNLRGKQVMLYAPTFRKDDAEFEKRVNELAKSFQNSDYVLVIKLHPLSGFKVSADGVIQDGSFSTMDFALVADKIILDYSAVLFEIAKLKKPMYFYAFDFDSYTDKRDFYLDYKKEMPGGISADLETLLEKINTNSVSEKTVEDFCDRMIAPSKTGSYTEDFVRFVEKSLNI